MITVVSVDRVYDGDTFTATFVKNSNVDFLDQAESCCDNSSIKDLLKLSLCKVPIRIRGIDTPEIRGTPEDVKTLAVAARERLKSLLLPKGTAVFISDVGRCKYFRYVATVWIKPPGASVLTNVGDVLVAEGHAKVTTQHVVALETAHPSEEEAPTVQPTSS
jgi:endonuclease YncB( thermonuclease family)